MTRNTRRGPSDLVSRRAFLGSAGLTGAALAAPLAGQHTTEAPPPLDRPDGLPDLVAHNEAYWTRVAAHYRVSGSVTNLDAGYWGMMSAPVLAEYVRQTERVNLENSFYALQRPRRPRSFGGGAERAVAPLKHWTLDEFSLPS